jgi:hypothetical protein
MVLQEVNDVCYQHIFSLFTIIGPDSLKIKKDGHSYGSDNVAVFSNI